MLSKTYDPIGLTERQEEILVFIGNEATKRCSFPSIREIGDHCGIGSTNGVSDHLRALARKGYVEPSDGRVRRIMLTETGWEYVEVFGLFGTMAKRLWNA